MKSGKLESVSEGLADVQVKARSYKPLFKTCKYVPYEIWKTL